MNIPPINQQVALAAKANREQAWPSEFTEAYDATWFTIDESNDVIGRLNKSVFELDKEGSEVVFLMLFNGLSDIISAVYTLSSGWIRPSVTALRGALETIATAAVVHHDSEKMARFVDGKLRVPEDILRQAKQFFPSIGRLYGALTNQWTHETFDSTARSIHADLGKLLMVPTIGSENIKIYLNVFVEAAVLAQMVGIGLETCFPNLTGDEIHFSIGLNGERSRRAAPSSDAIRTAVQARGRA
jgi:hypothetical protein